MNEALAELSSQGVHIDAMRVRAFPFAKSVGEFIAAHEQVFVIEQNESGQLRSMIINELEINPAKLVKMVHYDGTPITARFICKSIHKTIAGESGKPALKVAT